MGCRLALKSSPAGFGFGQCRLLYYIVDERLPGFHFLQASIMMNCGLSDHIFGCGHKLFYIPFSWHAYFYLLVIALTLQPLEALLGITKCCWQPQAFADGKLCTCNIITPAGSIRKQQAGQGLSTLRTERGTFVTHTSASEQQVTQVQALPKALASDALDLGFLLAQHRNITASSCAGEQVIQALTLCFQGCTVTCCVALHAVHTSATDTVREALVLFSTGWEAARVLPPGMNCQAATSATSRQQPVFARLGFSSGISSSTEASGMVGSTSASKIDGHADIPGQWRHAHQAYGFTHFAALPLHAPLHGAVIIYAKACPRSPPSQVLLSDPNRTPGSLPARADVNHMHAAVPSCPAVGALAALACPQQQAKLTAALQHAFTMHIPCGPSGQVSMDAQVAVSNAASGALAAWRRLPNAANFRSYAHVHAPLATAPGTQMLPQAAHGAGIGSERASQRDGAAHASLHFASICMLLEEISHAACKLAAGHNLALDVHAALVPNASSSTTGCEALVLTSASGACTPEEIPQQIQHEGNGATGDVCRGLPAAAGHSLHDQGSPLAGPWVTDSPFIYGKAQAAAAVASPAAAEGVARSAGADLKHGAAAACTQAQLPTARLQCVQLQECHVLKSCLRGCLKQCQVCTMVLPSESIPCHHSTSQHSTSSTQDPQLQPFVNVTTAPSTQNSTPFSMQVSCVWNRQSCSTGNTLVLACPISSLGHAHGPASSTMQGTGNTGVRPCSHADAGARVGHTAHAPVSALMLCMHTLGHTPHAQAQLLAVRDSISMLLRLLRTPLHAHLSCIDLDAVLAACSHPCHAGCVQRSGPSTSLQHATPGCVSAMVQDAAAIGRCRTGMNGTTTSLLAAHPLSSPSQSATSSSVCTQGSATLLASSSRSTDCANSLSNADSSLRFSELQMGQSEAQVRFLKASQGTGSTCDDWGRHGAKVGPGHTGDCAWEDGEAAGCLDTCPDKVAEIGELCMFSLRMKSEAALLPGSSTPGLLKQYQSAPPGMRPGALTMYALQQRRQRSRAKPLRRLHMAAASAAIGSGAGGAGSSAWARASHKPSRLSNTSSACSLDCLAYAPGGVPACSPDCTNPQAAATAAGNSTFLIVQLEQEAGMHQCWGAPGLHPARLNAPGVQSAPTRPPGLTVATTATTPALAPHQEAGVLRVGSCSVNPLGSYSPKLMDQPSSEAGLMHGAAGARQMQLSQRAAYSAYGAAAGRYASLPLVNGHTATDGMGRDWRAAEPSACILVLPEFSNEKYAKPTET